MKNGLPFIINYSLLIFNSFYLFQEWSRLYSPALLFLEEGDF